MTSQREKETFGGTLAVRMWHSGTEAPCGCLCVLLHIQAWRMSVKLDLNTLNNRISKCVTQLLKQANGRRGVEDKGCLCELCIKPLYWVALFPKRGDSWEGNI